MANNKTTMQTAMIKQIGNYTIHEPWIRPYVDRRALLAYATHPAQGKVVLKIANATEPANTESNNQLIQDEANWLQQLKQCSGVIQILPIEDGDSYVGEASELPGKPKYIVLEPLSRDLQEIMESSGSKLSFTEALHNTYPLATTLAQIHALGCVHRDIKPGNILFDDADSNKRPILIDFNISVKNGELVEPWGTKRWMCTEMLSTGTAHPSWDVYALALLFFYMLTGEQPEEPQQSDYSGETLRGFISKGFDALKNNEEFMTLHESEQKEMIAFFENIFVLDTKKENRPTAQQLAAKTQKILRLLNPEIPKIQTDNNIGSLIPSTTVHIPKERQRGIFITAATIGLLLLWVLFFLFEPKPPKSETEVAAAAQSVSSPVVTSTATSQHTRTATPTSTVANKADAPIITPIIKIIPTTVATSHSSDGAKPPTTIPTDPLFDPSLVEVTSTPTSSPTETPIMVTPTQKNSATEIPIEDTPTSTGSQADTPATVVTDPSTPTPTITPTPTVTDTPTPVPTLVVPTGDITFSHPTDEEWKNSHQQKEFLHFEWAPLTRRGNRTWCYILVISRDSKPLQSLNNKAVSVFSILARQSNSADLYRDAFQKAGLQLGQTVYAQVGMYQCSDQRKIPTIKKESKILSFVYSEYEIR